MTYETIPDNFNPRFEIAGCFMEFDGRVILLHRHAGKSQGGRWGLPAGKLDPGEDAKSALVREIREETGLDIPKDAIAYTGKTFHHHGDYDFVFHTFSTKLDAMPSIRINTYEHQEFVWKTPAEILAMNSEELVEDFADVCNMFLRQRNAVS